MADEQKTINWASVLTTAVSTLVATIVVGAAVMVWNKTANIDEDIATATKDIKKNQEALQAQYLTMAEEIASLHGKIRKLRSQLDSHDEVLRDKSTVTSFPKDEPLVLAKYKLSDRELSELAKKDAERILKAYQKKKSAIQQQAMPLR